MFEKLATGVGECFLIMLACAAFFWFVFFVVERHVHKKWPFG